MRTLDPSMSVCLQKIVIILLLSACITTNGTFSQELLLEEITVTARKREENLQKVPISITAFSADDLEMRSIADTKDLSRFSPNLYISNTGGGSPDTPMIYMRGIGQNDYFVTTDSGVGTYVDGIFIGRAFGGIMDILDLERIEILRGPQGTLFGKNTIGGAINIVSRAPLGENAGQVSVSYGNNNRVEVGGSYDMTLVEDTLLARGSILYKRRDCLTRNLNNDACYADMDGFTTRGYLRWLVSDRLTADFIVDYTDRDGHSVPQSLLDVNDSPGTVVSLWNQFTADGLVNGPIFDKTAKGFVSNDPYVTEGNRDMETPLEVFGVSGKLTWQLTDNMTIYSITAYRSADAVTDQNPDGHSALFAHVHGWADTYQLSQEFRLEGISFHDRLDWTVGVYYFMESSESRETLELFPELGGGFGSSSYNEQDSDSFAAFGHLSYNMTDKLRISGGVRYTDEEKDWYGGSAGPLDPPDQFSILPAADHSQSWNEWSPKVALDYQLTDDVLIFASASKGFRSGGFNGRAQNTFSTIPFNPETVWSYEVGFKSQFLDNRLRVNATGFYADYTEKQELIIRGFTDPVTGNTVLVTIVENAAEASLHGAEFEILGLVGEGLKLEANVGYTKGEFKKIAPTAAVITIDSPFTYTPKWNLSLAGEYNFSVPEINGSMTIRTDYTYRDDVHFTTTPSQFTIQKGFGLLNARLIYESDDGLWNVALWGRNLTDKIYKLHSEDFSAGFGISFAWWSDEREFGVTVKRKF